MQNQDKGSADRGFESSEEKRLSLDREGKAMELRAFLELNAAMALRALLDQVQSVERCWEDEKARGAALERLREILDASALHRSEEVRNLSFLRQRLPEDPTFQQFLALFVPIERAHGRLVTDSDFLVRSQDAERQPSTRKFPLILVLDNIRSVFNVGSILRLAESLGLEKVFLCGYTARPDQDKVARSALGAETMIAWEWFAHAAEALAQLKLQNIPVFAFETAESAKSLEEWVCPQQKIALLFGNERYGLERPLLELCDGLIEIQPWGQKNSLNVAVTAGIGVFEVRRQWLSASWIER